MNREKLKEEFGELTEEETRKVEDWETMAKKILEKRKAKDVEDYVRDQLRDFRRNGGLKHESEK